MSETYHLLYSTPSCYLQAINSLNTTWPTKDSDDFFPYGSDEHSYWTGYFTSRPAFKNMVYKANNILQVSNNVMLRSYKHRNKNFFMQKYIIERCQCLANVGFMNTILVPKDRECHH